MNIDERAAAVDRLFDKTLEASERMRADAEALAFRVDSLVTRGVIDTTDWPESAREDLKTFRAARDEWNARYDEWDEARRAVGILAALRTQREATGVVPR